MTPCPRSSFSMVIVVGLTVDTRNLTTRQECETRTAVRECQHQSTMAASLWIYRLHTRNDPNIAIFVPQHMIAVGYSTSRSHRCPISFRVVGTSHDCIRGSPNLTFHDLVGDCLWVGLQVDGGEERPWQIFKELRNHCPGGGHS